MSDRWFRCGFSLSALAGSFFTERLAATGKRPTSHEADDKEDLLVQGIITVTHIDTSRRQQLAARLKSAVATAALVATLAGWIAFGTQEPATTTVVTTAVLATAPAVAEASTPNNTTASGIQPDQSDSSAAATDIAPSATPNTSSDTTTQSGTTAPSSASSSSSVSRRGPVTTTRSSQ